MTEQNATETGVSKLTPGEKKALQQWINKHHTVKPGSSKKQQPQVSEVLVNGHYIKLSDGTIWKIHPSDTPITSSWITAANIEIVATGSDAGYPYTLTNALTGSKVQAQKVQSVPKDLTKPRVEKKTIPTPPQKKKKQSQSTK